MRGHKQDRILRALLTEDKILSKNELSKKAECSRQWIILFLRKLEKQGLIKNTKILNKTKLLNYWLNIYKKPKKYREYMVKEPLKLLKKSKLDYALTTYQAENIIQRYLFPSRTDVYIIRKDLEKWHSILKKQGLYGKGNFRIIIKDENVMYGKRKVNSVFIVCLPQLIIDLFKEGGSCEEAANMLLEKLNKNVS